MPVGITTIGNEGKRSSATFVVAASDSLHKERADYVCVGVDDQKQIHAAIDALPSGGGKIILLEGIFDLTSQIHITDDHVTLEGQGHGTMLRIQAGFSSGQLIYLDAAHYSNLKDFYIYGSSISGKIAIQSNLSNYITIERINIVDTGSVDTYSIHINDGIKPYISNCYIHNSSGICVYRNYGSIITGCFVENALKDGIRCCYNSDITVSNNYVKGCQNIRGILLCSGKNQKAIGNTLVDNQLAIGGFYAESQGVIVSNNIFIGDGTFNGVRAIGTHTVNHTNMDYLIEGNIFYNHTIGVLVDPEQGSPAGVIRRVSIKNNKFVSCATGVFVNKPTEVFDTVIESNDFNDCATPIYDNGTNTKYFNGAFGLFMDILVASGNHVHAAITGTGAEQEITTAITNPDVPRNISITNSANSTGDVEIDGIDAKGNSVSDTITIVTGGIAYGVVAFATVSKITIPSTVANPDTITVGISDKLGLSNIIYASGDVYKVKVNNADDPTIGTVNTTYDTVDCAVINAGDDITIWYNINLNMIS